MTGAASTGGVPRGLHMQRCHSDDGSDSDGSDSDIESQHEEEQQAQRVLQRGRELRDVQLELDRVNKLYKRKSPLVRLPPPAPLTRTTKCTCMPWQSARDDHACMLLQPASVMHHLRPSEVEATMLQVRDANEFEALCMSSSRGSSRASGGSESTGQADTDAEAEAGVAHNGLERRQAKVRIHAVPFPIQPEDNVTGIDVSGDRMLFYYQLLVENLGDTAVQLLGRFHEISCPWDVIRYGCKDEPMGHRTEGVVVMPGCVVLEQQYAVMEGSQGTMKGGLVVCSWLCVHVFV